MEEYPKRSDQVLTGPLQMLALPIFPGRLQPSIVGRTELNFRVRDGNGWTLDLINTNYCTAFTQAQLELYHDLLVLSSLSFKESGDP